MKRRWRRITPEKRHEIIRLAAHGATYRQIADELDLSCGAVGLVLTPLGGVSRREIWDPGTRRLSLDERIEIRVGLERERSHRAIARSIGRDPATVCREVKGNGGRHDYRPLKAHPVLCARVGRG